MKQSWVKEVFSMPNILGYGRILLIPVFVWLYCTAEDTWDYLAAASVIVLSGLTDKLDGWIARRFDMVTELGKVLDPVADKLTQCAVIICLALRFELMRWIIVLFVFKEGFMAVMAFLLLQRKGRKLNGAKWFGKGCTAILYLVMFLLVLLPGLPAVTANILMGISIAALLFSLVMYGQEYKRMWRD